MAANQDKHGNHHVHPTVGKIFIVTPQLVASTHPFISSDFSVGGSTLLRSRFRSFAPWVLLGWQWFIASKLYRTSRRTNCGVCALVAVSFQKIAAWLLSGSEKISRVAIQLAQVFIAFIGNVFHPGTIFFDAKKQKNAKKIRRTSFSNLSRPSSDSQTTNPTIADGKTDERQRSLLNSSLTLKPLSNNA